MDEVTKRRQLKKLESVIGELGPALSDEETQHVMLMALKDGPKSNAEIERILDWCVDAKINAGLLENVVTGHMTIAYPDDADDARFSLTEKGRAHVESLVVAKGPR